MGGRTGARARVGAGGTFWLPPVTNGNLYGVSGCYEIQVCFFINAVAHFLVIRRY